jgi:hypothetical protein
MNGIYTDPNSLKADILRSDGSQKLSSKMFTFILYIIFMFQSPSLLRNAFIRTVSFNNLGINEYCDEDV